MNTQQSRLGVEHYLAGMRAALADLPAGEVAEIMEDVEPQLAEIEAELGEGETLEQRLGPPEAYAAELRAAAGYPPSEPVRIAAPKLLSKQRIAVWGLGGATAFTLIAATAVLREAAVLLLPAAALAVSLALVHGMGPQLRPVMELPEVRKVKEMLDQPEGTPAGKAIRYLRSLQPAWWLARSALLVLAAVLLTRTDLFAFLVVAALAVVAFYAGPKSKTDRRWMWVTLPASALAVGVVLQMIDVAAYSVRFGGSSSYPVPTYQEYERYENIYPYDSNGKPLDGVLLFDQDGNAINAPGRTCPGSEPVIPNNRYPRPKIDYDNNGRCVTVPPSVSTSPSSSPVPSSSVPPSVTVTPSPSK